MFFFDPMYFLFLLPGLLLGLWASHRVRSNFRQYSEVIPLRGFTGAQVATKLLAHLGIQDVQVVPTQGYLTDHYNPVSRELVLSEDVYYGRSIAAIGVAAHEVGHAIQHANNYAPLWIRSALVPTVNVGSTLGYIVMIAGLFLSPYLVLAGVILFSTVLVFQLVTLPVEFDATARAKQLVVETGIVTSAERKGMDRVLDAAALTYVAAVVSTFLVILYYLWVAFGSNR